MGDDNSTSVLSQDEINKLLNGESGAGEAAESENPTKSESPGLTGGDEETSGTLAQDELDKLFAETVTDSSDKGGPQGPDGSTQPEKNEIPGKGETPSTDGEKSGLLSDEDLAYYQAYKNSKPSGNDQNADAGGTKPSAADESDSGGEGDGVTFSQNDLDKLFTENVDTKDSVEPEPPEPAAEEENDGVTFSQNDLDNLFNENVTSEAPDEPESTESAAEEENDGVTFSQNDLDQLFTENVEAGNAGEAEPIESARDPEPEDGILSQGDLDKLISETVETEDTGDPEPPEISVDPGQEDGALSQDDLDKLISSSIEDDPAEGSNEEKTGAGQDGDPPDEDKNTTAENQNASLLSDEDLAYYQAFKQSKTSSTAGSNQDGQTDPANGGNDATDDDGKEENQTVEKEDPDSGSGPADSTKSEDPPNPSPPASPDPEETSPLDDAIAVEETEAPDMESEIPDPEPENGAETDENFVIDTFEEVIEKNRSPFKKILAMTAVFIVIVGSAGWYFHGGRTGSNPEQAQPAEEPKEMAEIRQPVETSASPNEPTPSQAIPTEPAVTDKKHVNILSGPLEKSVREADELRTIITAKQKEMTDLRAYYQNGIDEGKKELRQAIANGNSLSMENFLQNKEMVLTLQTIRRRQAYIAHLEEIHAELELADEELLFLKRQAIISSILSPVAKGLDIDSQAIHLHSVTQTHAVGIDNIIFDPSPDRLNPLHVILEETISGTGVLPEPTEDRPSGNPVSIDNPNAIDTRGQPRPVSDACRKDIDRKHSLSSLTAKTARCLSDWNGKDMVLKDVTNLSPDAASQLAQWKGKWIALNALQSISQDTAEQLFLWEGNRLSLNGVEKLTPQVSRYIPTWRGKHLELTGLTDLPFEVASDLAKWQKSGGTVWLPERLKGKN